ncbi:unnamed protein product [Ceutorhynchus assimilis]|uniref:C2H2-type domain-containing protein n=1 Tax=Ceutorhynchus assimilis TaxID=467358 RepID=A0A9N9N134_9CUCU|nr:unnamed protein product [Ceutorhynchus assimilis]
MHHQTKDTNYKENSTKDRKISLPEKANLKKKKGKRRSKVSQELINNIGKHEKLVIRLVKLDISAFNSNSPTPKNNEVVINKHSKPTKKVCKSDIQKHNLLNVNKTESRKIEEMLLKKHQSVKQKRVVCLDDDSFKPYVYQKTNKPVFETYKVVLNDKKEKILCCLLCPFTAETFHSISMHYKFKHRETPIEEMHFCDVKDCKFTSVHKGMFKWHMRRHALLSDDKPLIEQYTCEHCSKVFNQRKGYLLHLKHKHKEPLLAASEQTVFPCSTCKFKTNIQRNLQMHIYRCHVPDSQRTSFTCNVCGFETYYKVSLKKHLNQVHMSSKSQS